MAIGVATIKDLSLKYATKQPQQVDYLTEEAPILGLIPWQQSTHDFWNVHEQIIAGVGAQFVDFDAALPTVSSDSKLMQTNLLKFGGKISVGHDKALGFGSPAAYYATKMPTILRTSGQTAEVQILYQNIRAYAIEAHANADYGSLTRLIDAGGTGDTNYSIVACKFVPGENIGLWTPRSFSQGAILTNVPINGGALHDIGSGVLGYATALMSFWGYLLANPRHVAAIVNINASNKPTEAEIDTLLMYIRASGLAPGRGLGNSFMFMHPQVLTWLYEYKNEKLRMINTDMGLNNQIEAWNGVPIVTSYNFLDGTETDVTVA